jgi:hypothetical protein
MHYRRDAAIAYARKYWDRPCEDGVFWCNDHVVEIAEERKHLKAPVTDGWEARFVPDGHEAEHAVFQRSVRGAIEEKVIQKWEGLADCAHFLTRCIQAGGLRISEISVPKLIAHLKGRSDVKVLAEQLTRAQGQRVVDTGLLKTGDMVGYFNIDPMGDYGGRRQYSHSTMYVGKLNGADDGRITCHTKSRFAGLSAYPDQWHLDVDLYTYTFIHFAHDDVAPLSVTSSLSGWWQKKDDATGYYYLTPNGRAYLSMRPPTTHLDPPSTSLNSAYWFLRGGEITFIWKPRGDVDVWRPSGHPDEFATILNGVRRTPVVKMSRDTRR